MSGASTAASCRPVARGQVGQFRSASDCQAVCGRSGERRYVCDAAAPYFREAANDLEFSAGKLDPVDLRCFRCDEATGACAYDPTAATALYATPEGCAAACKAPPARFVCDAAAGGPRAATTAEERARGAAAPELLSCFRCDAGACVFAPAGDGEFKTADCGGGCYFRCAPTEPADGVQRVERTTAATGFLTADAPRCFGCVGPVCAYVADGSGTATTRAGCGVCAPPADATYACTEQTDQDGNQVLATLTDGSGAADATTLRCWAFDADTGAVTYRPAGDGNQKSRLAPAKPGTKYYKCDPGTRGVVESATQTPFESPNAPACFACRGAVCDFVPEGTGAFREPTCANSCKAVTYYECTPETDAATGLQVTRATSSPTPYTSPNAPFCYECVGNVCTYRADGAGQYRVRSCDGACPAAASRSFLDRLKALPWWAYAIAGGVLILVLVLIFRPRKKAED